MLILRKPWTRQPQGPVGIDWSNPLTVGLDYAVTGGIEHVRGTWLAAPVNIGRYGKTQRLIAPYRASADVAACTIIAHHRYTSDNSDYAGVAWGYYVSGADCSQVGVNFGPISGIADMFGLHRGNSDGVTTVVTDPALPYDVVLATRHTIASATAGDFFINGALQGTTIAKAGTGTFAQDTRRTFSIMTPTSTGKESAFAFKWGRLLTNAEIAAISANPWQLFATQQIIIPTPAAASSAPTITALSAIGITATSAQPRISYS